MLQKTMNHLAKLLRAGRPDPRASADEWQRWSDTVKEVAQLAQEHPAQEAQFLRDAGHSA